ncbi:MAG: ribonuclease H family protein [Chromatocurvus sp.]
MAKQKFYVVWRGIAPGIYTSWADAEKQVKGVAGARYKSFASRTEAEAALQSGPGKMAARKTASSGTKTRSAPDKSARDPVRWHDVDIYCDGGCNPNPGPAGTGLAVYRNHELSELWYGLYQPAGTNNTAELKGLGHALGLAKEAIVEGRKTAIHCDSRYAIDCVTKWAFGWKARGWTRKTGQIMNLELIQDAHALYMELADHIAVLHVPGHAGIEGNELADRMSMLAIQRAETELVAFPPPFDIPTLLALDHG